MMAPSEPQRLPSRLAPLREALARIDALARPVSPRVVELSAAAGRVLAADVAVAAPLPPTAVALRDGWAVRSDQIRRRRTLGAGRDDAGADARNTQ